MWTRIGISWASLAAQTTQVLKVTPKRTKHTHVGVISAPFNKGQRRDGVKDGPTAVAETGVLNRLKSMGVDIVDYGTVPMESEGKGAKLSLGPDGERNHNIVLSYSQKLAASVSSVIQKGALCLTLGGDHSIAIGTVTGHAQANPDHQVVVLWIDAHADINTGGSSNSGNMHGMPVSHHLRELSNDINKLPSLWPTPSISAEHIVYIGLRDVDDAEQKFIDQLGILQFNMQAVDDLGIEKVIQKSLEKLQPSACRPLHISFDIDSLDPAEAPSTGTPVRAGLTLREGLKIVEAARDTGFLKAFDMVEVNPALGSREDAIATSQAAKAVLLGALAGRRGT